MTSAQSLQMQAAQAWARGDLYGADDALRTLVSTQGGATPQTDLMTLRLALDLLEFERAEEALSRLRDTSGADPQVAMAGARLLTWQGKRDEALQLLGAALRAAPDHPGLLALWVTHGRDLSGETLSRAEEVAGRLPDTAPEKTGLLFPLARHYDRAGQYDRAWALARQANTLASAHTPPVAPQALKQTLISRAQRSLEAAQALTSAPPHDQRHVYLIGAPRTGSSLLQSILSAHEDVDSSGERGALLPYLHEITDSAATPPPDYLTRLQAADLSGLNRAGRTASTLIDKTTHNAFIAPLIAAIHPQSVFINVTRRPQDVALSMLFHEFPAAFPESVSLDGITTMLEARAGIMTLYSESVFQVHDFDFDAFTKSPETRGETLGERAQIPFNPSYLSPKNRNAAVPTFSAGQVRQPIKPTPPEKWQRFAPFMDERVKDRLDALAAAL
ncbi:MAG: sulfotransferase [Pseudomonadota bacterium]